MWKRFKQNLQVQHLLSELKSGDRYRIQQAACELGQMNHPRAGEPLIETLERYQHDFRAGIYDDMVVAVIEALGRLGTTQAMELLVKLCRVGNSRWRSAAVASLQQLGWQPTSLPEQLTYALARKKWDELHQISDSRLEEVLVDLLSGWNDAQDVAEVLQALGRLNDERFISVIGSKLMLLDQLLPPWQVEGVTNAVAAVSVLNEMIAREKLSEAGNRKVLELLIDALKSSHTELQEAIIETLIQYESLALPLLGNVLNILMVYRQQDELYVLSIAKVLANYESSKAVTLLAKLLDHENDFGIRYTALVWLGESKHPEAANVALKIIKSRDENVVLLERAVITLKQLMQRKLEDFPSEKLQEVAALSDQSMGYVKTGEEDSQDGYYSLSGGADCTVVKQIAHQELIRRGESHN